MVFTPKAAAINSQSQPSVASADYLLESLKPKPQPVFPNMATNYQTMIAAQTACKAKGGTFSITGCYVPPPPPAPTVVSHSCGVYRDLGYQMAIARGWGAYWGDLDYVIGQIESGWNNCAQNPHSAACGIGQDINGCEVGYDPVAQINWAFNYIAGRYGNPANAAYHERTYNWY